MIFGLIGLGRFGQLLADTLASFGEVRAFDIIEKKHSSTIQITSLAEVLQADIIFILVPMSEFEKPVMKLNLF